ncbi:MAG: L-lactate dehydrogenase [Bacillota bacterium]
MEGPGSKVVIIGVGRVGATCAFALALGGTAEEIVLIDADAVRVAGEAMDLGHSLPYLRPAKIYAGDYPDCTDADIVIISAGVSQKPGETRIDLLKRNVAVFQDILPRLERYVNASTVVLVVTNPVDIMTYAALKYIQMPWQQVFGSGTSLDSARFRHALAQLFGVDSRNVHAYIIGEHGDTEVAAWSSAYIAGSPLAMFSRDIGIQLGPDEKLRIFEDVRDAAYRIIEAKGATYYAVAVSVRRIVESVLRNENSILSVSCMMHGEFGLEDVCLSLPAIIGRGGIKKVITPNLDHGESALLRESARNLKQIISQVFISP